MTALRCATVWEGLILFACLLVGVSALQWNRWLGAEIVCAEVALYCLGALNGRRLAQAASSMRNEQVAGDQ